MGAMQQDLTDVYARDITPEILKVARSMLSELSIEDRRDATKQMEYLDNFEGVMAEDSIGATVYMYWQI